MAKRPSLNAYLIATCLIPGAAGCTATMNDTWGRRQLSQFVPEASASRAKLHVYPIERAALDAARTKRGRLLCDAHGPAGDAAKRDLDRIAKAVAGIKPVDTGCERGEAKASGSTKVGAPKACLNMKDTHTTSTKLAISCEGGKVTLAIDAGTFELETLHGGIEKVVKDSTVTLVGWEPSKTRVIFVRAPIDGIKGQSSLYGDFLVADLGAQIKDVGDIVAEPYNYDQWELFALAKDGASGVYVLGPDQSPPIAGRKGFLMSAFHVQ
jgi:hypothetical protein